MDSPDSGAKIVVIGGGTGSFAVLSGLKNYVKNLTALVSMADDGGSSGRLIDEYGVLPPGDVRQCLVALSRSPLVRDLFNYRFDNGTFDGHSFGNIFLTVLEKLTGNFGEGVEQAGQILQITGRVEPITLDKFTLMMEDVGRVVKHEYNIDDRKFNGKRPRIWLEPTPQPNPSALKAICEADIVVIAPGSLYTSLGAVLVVPGVAESLMRTRAKVLYICNLINKPGQTDGFTVEDYVDELERVTGRKFVDAVLYNNRRPGNDLLQRYARDGETPVEFGRRDDRKYIGADLVAKKAWKSAKGDKVKRSLIRHDPDKLARQVMKLFFS
jgi:uncharacterized cofD-like protein